LDTVALASAHGRVFGVSPGRVRNTDLRRILQTADVGPRPAKKAGKYADLHKRLAAVARVMNLACRPRRPAVRTKIVAALTKRNAEDHRRWYGDRILG
jgi:hypothetical protein